MVVFQYISGVLVVAIIFLSSYGYGKIEGLKEQVVVLQSKLHKAKLLSKQYEIVITRQNMAVKNISADYNRTMKELEEWKTKPPEIRYNTIYKYIPRKVVESEDSCENTKNYLDAVRSIDINKL